MQFKLLGKLVDVYIARKTNKQGKRFSFLRFLGVEIIIDFLPKISNVCIANFKVKVSLARYERNTGKGASNQRIAGTNPPLVSAQNWNRSFADVVSGKKTLNNQEPLPSICLVTPEGTPRWLENKTLFGRVASLKTLWNLENLINAEGCSELKVRYSGGFSVLLESGNNSAVEDFLVNTKEVWSKWFITFRAGPGGF